MTALWLTAGHTITILGGLALAYWAYDEFICRPLDRIDWIRLYIRIAWRLRDPLDNVASAVLRGYYRLRYR